MCSAPKHQRSESSPDTRTALLAGAKRIFREQGYDGATVKAVAEAAGVNVGLISYFFGGKEGLFRACLSEFGTKNLELAQRVLQSPRSQEEVRIRLQMFFEEITNAHLSEPEVATILQRECDMEHPHSREVFQETFIKVFQHLVDFIRVAAEKGLVREGLDPMITASLHFSSLTNAFRMDRLAESNFGVTLRDPAYRAKFLKHHLDAILHHLGVPL